LLIVLLVVANPTEFAAAGTLALEKPLRPQTVGWSLTLMSKTHLHVQNSSPAK
jgi:hypothetical protein